MPRNWLSYHNFSYSSKRRIWIAWNPDIWSCTIIVASIQQITLAIKGKRGLEGFPTIIYGLHSQEESSQLWNKLQNLNVKNLPWLLTGDFNTARISNEKIR